MKRIYLQQAKTQIARPNTIRDINKQIVLNYVRDRSPISRADIARETALQRSTISAIVEDLQKAGLIEEIGTGDSTGGRKPTLLKLRTQAPVAIGVDVAPRITTVAIADLGGNVLEREEFPSDPLMSEMSRKIVDRVAALAKKYKNAELEVGISVPGIADQTTGKVVYIPFFDWSNWEIAEEITNATGLPVTVENDANAIALAELWFGEEKIRRTSNFITILVSEGVGTGIIFDGQIYRGESGAAGEFGHMIVGKNAPVPCSCGSRDCWEAHASERAVRGRYLSYNGNTKSSNVSFDSIVDLAVQNDEHAVRAFKETAGYLGIGISNLIVGLSPQAIVVIGKVTRAWHLIENQLNEIAERSVRSGLPKTTISASTLGDSPTLIGALSLVLAGKFASAS
jgi:predicted NBD/HSP70 family sugar kinase